MKNNTGMLRALLQMFIISILLIIIFAAVTAALLSKEKIGEAYIAVPASVSALIGTFTGAFIVCRKQGRKPLPLSLAFAGILTVIILILTLIAAKVKIEDSTFLPTAAAASAGAILGGMFSTIPRKHRRGR